jgi:pimeloyl-ACP methyl ester carboxylesterase
MELAALRSIAQSGVHPVDVCMAWLSARSKLFHQGWGDEALLADPEQLRVYLDSVAAPSISWYRDSERRGVRVRDGSFVSPLDLLPQESSVAHVRSWERAGNHTACVILAASRDEGYRVRERVFAPLLDRGLDLYFLENAYYGLRRTPAGPSLATVSDHILMTVATLCEARALLSHLGGRYEKRVVTGYSMGGHLAALTAAITPEPVGCAALATGASAAAVYTQGLLHWSVDFQSLASGYENEAVARQRLQKLFLSADIRQHPRPMRCDAAVVVGCKRDAYVLPSETEHLHAYWTGSTLRWIDSGHFSALMTCRKELCDCVAEAAERL